MSQDRVLAWMFGVAFVFMFIMFNFAIHDRDTAMRASIETDGATVTVTCKEPSHE